MVEMDALAEKLFSLLKGNGLQIKIYDAEGAESVDPATGRRFFVASPNLMVTIDDDSGAIEFSKGAAVGNNDDVADLQKNVRKIANEFLLNFSIKVFGKAIEPRHFSYQAKKGNAVMESTQEYSVGDKVMTYIGGKWLPATITKPPLDLYWWQMASCNYYKAAT